MQPKHRRQFGEASPIPKMRKIDAGEIARIKKSAFGAAQS